MRLSVSRALFILCALIAFVPRTANAAETPQVASVVPLKLKVGERLTIRGSGFLKGRYRNTVVFKAPGARAVFAKAESATSTKLVVKVPAKLQAFLAQTSGRPVATRFRLRVLARRLSAAYTPARRSPVISAAVASAATPGAGSAAGPGWGSAASPVALIPAVAAVDTDRDGTPDATDADDDNDLLADTVETAIATDPLKTDTDGDAMEDGWEYQSAKDLNRESCPAAEYPTACPGAKPYPYKRPYTNPLFPDSGADYDGDYLTAGFEYAAWKRHGVRSLDRMWYSDGKQSSLDSTAGDGCVGLTEDPATGHVDEYPSDLLAYPSGTAGLAYEAPPTPRYAWLYGHGEYTLDTDPVGRVGHGCLSDDERDEDGDFLSNAEELNAMMSGANYVQTLFGEPAFKTLWEGTDALDADTDGDGLVDGMDDQDHDDFWNVEEALRGTESSKEQKQADGADQDTLPDPSTALDTEARTGLWVDPYNPCLPAVESRTCPRGLLLGGTAWRPFYTAESEAPLRRWPLYHRALYDGDADNAVAELWSGAPSVAQQLPLQQPGDPDPGAVEHPLLPRPA